MKELSIFEDESGDFGAFSKHSPYYIITMILHDQSQDITDNIAKLVYIDGGTYEKSAGWKLKSLTGLFCLWELLKKDVKRV